MLCPFCDKTIAKKDKYCKHCGKSVPEEAKLPIPLADTSPSEYSQEQERKALADCYEFLLGKSYMAAMTKLYALNPERVIKMTQGHLAVRLVKQPNKTQEEIEQELRDFFDDPVTIQNIGKIPLDSKRE